MVMKFLCDQMLGSLARWLRFLGFDTLYATQDMTDEEILAIAKKEDRILITRDKELVFRSCKHLIQVIHIKTDGVEDQILQTVKESNAKIETNLMLSRCAECNSLLQKSEKSSVKDKVPRKVFERHDAFLCCPVCKRVYWMGTHTDSIMKKLIHIQEMVAD